MAHSLDNREPSNQEQAARAPTLPIPRQNKETTEKGTRHPEQRLDQTYPAPAGCTEGGAATEAGSKQAGPQRQHFPPQTWPPARARRAVIHVNDDGDPPELEVATESSSDVVFYTKPSRHTTPATRGMYDGLHDAPK